MVATPRKMNCEAVNGSLVPVRSKLHLKPIGLIEAPPCCKLPSWKDSEVIEAQAWMDLLSQSHGFKPGAIRSGAKSQFTRTITTGCIRALSRHRGQDINIASVESYDAARGRSADLFGIVDALVVEVNPPRLRYVQAAGRDWQPHIQKMGSYEKINDVRKMLANPTANLELWGWRQVPRIKGDGGRSKVKAWLPTVQIVTLEFLLGHEPPQYVKFWET